MQLYPGWSARDNYGYGTKKKKRKKERTPIEPGGIQCIRHTLLLEMLTLGQRKRYTNPKCTLRNTSYSFKNSQLANGFV